MLSSFLNRPRARAARALYALGPIAGAVAAFFPVDHALAANWIFDPRIEAAAIYDDNYRLTDQPGQEIEVTGGALDASLGMRAESQRSSIELTPRIFSSFFPDASSEESTDYFFAATAETHTQRLMSRLGARYSDESVVSSELLPADFPGVNLGEAVSGDAGRVTVRNRRKLVALTPSMQYDWTERRHVTFDLHFVDTSYDSQLFEQTGYRDYGGGPGIVWDISQRHSLFLGLLASRYSPDNGAADTDTTGFQAEWRTERSEITRYYFRVGGSRAKRDAVGTSPSTSTSSFNGGAGVAWTFQVTQLVLDVLRSTVPSSAGAVVNRDELRFRVNRAFQPRLSGFFALRGVRSSGVENDVAPVRDRDYVTARAGFEWRANRQFSVVGAYDYAWQEFSGEPHDAVSNGVNLSLVYEPRRLK